jgi:hypothetical protein
MRCYYCFAFEYLLHCFAPLLRHTNTSLLIITLAFSAFVMPSQLLLALVKVLGLHQTNRKTRETPARQLVFLLSSNASYWWQCCVVAQISLPPLALSSLWRLLLFLVVSPCLVRTEACSRPCLNGRPWLRLSPANTMRQPSCGDRGSSRADHAVVRCDPGGSSTAVFAAARPGAAAFPPR